MANKEHLKILQQGKEAWNQWRKENPNLLPNLNGADLSNAMLSFVNFRNADLIGVNFFRTELFKADLTGANLWGACLFKADLNGANLCGAKLNKADLSDANFSQTKLCNADLNGADLRYARLVETDLTEANITNCSIYGISAWNLKTHNTQQLNLIISRQSEPAILVDNLEVAQFIYLLLNNQKIRDVINTIGQKAVLILGRFSPSERKEVLDAIAGGLRQKGFLPILFDFERSKERDFTETIKILAGLSLFVIADITNPKSAPLELQATVPDYKIPFVTILQEGEKPFSMFKDLIMYDWVLKPVITYSTKEAILAGLEQAVIKPALEKHRELISKKTEELSTRSIEEFLY